MQGFWGIVHYCEREECVNAGVIAGKGRDYGIRWARSDDRILHVFGSVDTARLQSAKKALENRLYDEVENSPEENVVTILSRFISMQSGNLQITYPRPSVVNNLDETLKQLYGYYLA